MIKKLFFNWETNGDEALVQQNDGEEQEEDDDISILGHGQSNKPVAKTNPKIPANSANSSN